MIGDRGSLWWSGEVGKAYFVQRSNDMITWTYMPVIKSGTGGLMDYSFTSREGLQFFRVKSTDSMGVDPQVDDFDGDGISNWDEVRSGGSRSDPFLWATDGSDQSDYFADTNNNDMPDGWEVKHGDLGALEPHTHDDQDTLTNIEESAFGTDPRKDDTDGDTVNDDIDAVPLEKMINWKRSPECRYAVVLLDEIEYDQGELYPEQVDINDNGDVLFRSYIPRSPTFDYDLKAWTNGSLVDLSDAMWSPDLSNDGYVYGYDYEGLRRLPVDGSQASMVEIPDDDSLWEIPEGDRVGRIGSGGLTDTAKMRGADHPAYSVFVDGYGTAVIQYDGSKWYTYAKRDMTKEPDEVFAIAVGEGNQVFWKKRDNFWVETYYYGATEVPIYGVASRTIPYGGTDSKTADSHFIFGKDDEWDNKNAYICSSADNYQTRLKLGDDAAVGSVSGRGEVLLGRSIWRNGKVHKMDDLLHGDGRYDVDFSGEINKHGVIAAVVKEVKDAEGKELAVAEQKDYVALLLPVEVVKLSPKLVDESDNEIEGSEKPAVAPRSTAMVERDPLADPQIIDASQVRIAWRDMKVRVGKPLAGKTVTWSMIPQFTPLQANGTPESASRFRGNWGTAANAAHRNYFSASAYGQHEFALVEEAAYVYGEVATLINVHQRATTTVDAEGYTAIRVNLPPIGFNKASIKIEIEDVENEIDLIELEVPAVIVIDPGHGTGGYVDGSAGGSVGLHTNVTEGDAALDIGTRTLNEIARIKNERGLLVKKYSTKPSNNLRVNIGLNDRENKAREFGADTYVSLHFDGATNDPNGKEALYRNPFGMIDQDDTRWNRNPRADWALALRGRMAVQTAIAAVEPVESIQASETAYDEWDAAHSPNAERLTSETNESRLQKGLGALNDGVNSLDPDRRQNGNYREGDIRYTPCRATLIEMERTANEQADNLFNGNTAYNPATGSITLTALAESMRARVASEIAEACIDDVLIRDLTDQADVPVRTSRVPRLDFENN